MSQSKMTQDRFNEKMDALDKVNPAPLARLMASTEQCADPIVERNVSLLRQRSTVGVKKYGTTLADNKLPLRAWLNHALEEALDQANYLQAAMAEIDSDESKVADATESAELFGISYLVDGVNVHPSRVTVLRPSIAAAPVQAQEPVAWMVGLEVFDTLTEAKLNVRNPELKPEPLYRTPVQPVAVLDGFEQVRFRFFKELNTDERKKVFKAFGVWPGDGEGKNIPHVWETLLLRSIFNIAAPAAQDDASQAAIDVLAERRRQIDQEGWKAADDDKHADGQMAVAAGYYAMACGYPHERDIGGGIVPQYWPWGRNWWKPKGKRANLVRSGALILAEIERIDRATIVSKETATPQ